MSEKIEDLEEFGDIEELFKKEKEFLEKEPSIPEVIERDVEPFFEILQPSPSHFLLNYFYKPFHFLLNSIYRLINLGYSFHMGFKLSQVLTKETYIYGNCSYNPSFCELDILIPKRTPVSQTYLVHFHGGGYIFGDKTWYDSILSYFVKEGFHVVNFNYPLAPNFRFPIPIKASLQMLMWLKKERNVTHVSLMGDSAGGSLALYVALLVQNPALMHFIFGSDFIVSKDAFPKVTCVIDLYGTNDRTTWKESISYIGPWLLEEYIPASQGGLNCDDLYATNCGTPYDLLAYHKINFPDKPLSLCPLLFITSLSDFIHNSTLRITKLLREMNFLNYKILNKNFSWYKSHGFLHFYWEGETKQTYEEITNFLKTTSI